MSSTPWLTRTPYYVASRLAELAFIDSGIVLDRLELEECLRQDALGAGYLPDDTQCEVFIRGGDDGRPPAQLVRDFPKTNAYIEERF